MLMSLRLPIVLNTRNHAVIKRNVSVENQSKLLSFHVTDAAVLNDFAKKIKLPALPAIIITIRRNPSKIMRASPPHLQQEHKDRLAGVFRLQKNNPL